MNDLPMYRRGNTKLLRALMEMCDQYLSLPADEDLLYHSHMSAGENALDILAAAGMATTEDGVHYRLNWSAIEQRESEEK